MIVVLGRPGLDAASETGLTGRAARLALQARAAGSEVELVGSVGDDAAGDEVVTLLGRAGVGHAALLRDPAGHTPSVASVGGRMPRLDAADLSLGLSYLAECRVIVAADEFDADALRVIAEAAEYHGASLIAIVAAGTSVSLSLGSRVTLLETPDEDETEALDALTARYAVAIDAGMSEADAFRALRDAPGVDRISE